MEYACCSRPHEILTLHLSRKILCSVLPPTPPPQKYFVFIHAREARHTRPPSTMACAAIRVTKRKPRRAQKRCAQTTPQQRHVFSPLRTIQLRVSIGPCYTAHTSPSQVKIQRVQITAVSFEVPALVRLARATLKQIKVLSRGNGRHATTTVQACRYGRS